MGLESRFSGATAERNSYEPLPSPEGAGCAGGPRNLQRDILRDQGLPILPDAHTPAANESEAAFYRARTVKVQSRVEKFPRRLLGRLTSLSSREFGIQSAKVRETQLRWRKVFQSTFFAALVSLLEI